MHKQHGSAVSITLIVVLVFVIIGVLGYVFYQNFIIKAQETTQSSTTTETNNSSDKTKQFQSERHGITFDYPAEWTATETVSEYTTDEWYMSSVDVKNAAGKTVAILGTGGQFGGMCDENAPFQATYTTVKDELDAPGMKPSYFGYTIVEVGDGSYSAAYGLMTSDTGELAAGNDSVQCPGLEINYAYVSGATKQAIASMSFGLWYGVDGAEETPFPLKSFSSLNEAMAYADSDEFVAIMTMVKSLRVDS